LLDKWRLVWSGRQWNELLGLIDQSPQLQALGEELGRTHQLLHERTVALNNAQNLQAQQQSELESLKEEYQRLNNEHQRLSNEHRCLNDNFQQLQSDHIALNLAHEELDRGVREILASFSWRVTAPYRWLAMRLRRRLVKQRPAVTVQPQTTSDRNLDAGPLQGGLLTPPQDNLLFTQPITVQAWAWSPETGVSADILLDGSLVHALVLPV
jgi:hypothetical protein